MLKTSLIPSIKYIEIDSSFRDRTLYPNPSEFVVEMSQTGQADRFAAKDPVCDSAPVLVFDTSFVDITTGAAPSNTIAGITVSSTTLPSLEGTTKFKITTAGPVPGPEGSRFRQIRDFYVGSALTVTTGGVTYTSRIVEYLPLDVHTAIVRVDSALPSQVIGLTTFHIDNPTPLSTATLDAVIKFYIPGSNDCQVGTSRLQTFGLGGENYYVGYYILEHISRTYRKIIAFDKETRLATLESNTAGTWPVPPLDDWTITFAHTSRQFLICKEIPFGGSNLYVMFNDTSGTSLTLYWFGEPEPFYSIPFVGSFAFYDYSDNLAFRQFPAPAPIGESRRIVDFVNTGFDGLFYEGILRVFPGFSNANPLVLPSFRSIYIEPFSRDNATQFNFTGALVTRENTDTYEVELLNLIVPNTLLRSGRGGRVLDQPYLYVELQPISTGAFQTQNVIYSNNPNSTRVLFRAILDYTQPEDTPFVRLDGDGMVHTISIKPNNNFRFAVYHQSGEVIQTVIEDTVSPVAPNPLAQISACFAFKKIYNTNNNK